jgi:hypothetical protein
VDEDGWRAPEAQLSRVLGCGDVDIYPGHIEPRSGEGLAEPLVGLLPVRAPVDVELPLVYG